MNYPKNVDTRFDNEFMGISGLTWFPWVGKDYFSKNVEKRLLIIGESHYDWREEGSKIQLADKAFTRNVVEQQGLMLSNYKHWRFMRNIEKAFFAEHTTSNEKREILWYSVAFYNFVQRYMETKQSRPSAADYTDAWNVFFQVVQILKPRFCLFLGNEPLKIRDFQKLTSEVISIPTSIELGEKVGRYWLKSAKIEFKTGLLTTLIFIKHPSSYFRWNKWGEVLLEQMPDFIQELKILDNKT
jgi:hypothetical protein